MCDETTSGQDLSFSIFQTNKKYDAADAVALAPSECKADYITIAGKNSSSPTVVAYEYLISYTNGKHLISYLCLCYYIGGASECTTGNYRGALRDNFCGSKFNVDVGASQHAPICGKYLSLLQF